MTRAGESYLRPWTRRAKERGDRPDGRDAQPPQRRAPGPPRAVGLKGIRRHHPCRPRVRRPFPGRLASWSLSRNSRSSSPLGLMRCSPGRRDARGGGPRAQGRQGPRLARPDGQSESPRWRPCWTDTPVAGGGARQRGPEPGAAAPSPTRLRARPRPAPASRLTGHAGLRTAPPALLPVPPTRTTRCSYTTLASGTSTNESGNSGYSGAPATTPADEVQAREEEKQNFQGKGEASALAPSRPLLALRRR